MESKNQECVLYVKHKKMFEQYVQATHTDMSNLGECLCTFLFPDTISAATKLKWGRELRAALRLAGLDKNVYKPKQQEEENEQVPNKDVQALLADVVFRGSAYGFFIPESLKYADEDSGHHDWPQVSQRLVQAYLKDTGN
jgi:hypothetical protein